MVYGNKCLDANGQGTANGTQVIIWDCNGQTNQQWNVNANGTHHRRAVRAVPGRATAPARPTARRSILWACNGGTNQQWSLRS